MNPIALFTTDEDATISDLSREQGSNEKVVLWAGKLIEIVIDNVCLAPRFIALCLGPLEAQRFLYTISLPSPFLKPGWWARRSRTLAIGTITKDNDHQIPQLED